jgi:hypothetical protein
MVLSWVWLLLVCWRRRPAWGCRWRVWFAEWRGSGSLLAAGRRRTSLRFQQISSNACLGVLCVALVIVLDFLAALLLTHAPDRRHGQSTYGTTLVKGLPIPLLPSSFNFSFFLDPPIILIKLF